MTNINLTQAEADDLIAMEKHRLNGEWHRFPALGGSLVLPLQSSDRREQFQLDISQGRIDLLKVKMQNRARQVVVLVRLDLWRSTPESGWRGSILPSPACLPRGLW